MGIKLWSVRASRVDCENILAADEFSEVARLVELLPSDTRVNIDNAVEVLGPALRRNNDTAEDWPFFLGSASFDPVSGMAVIVLDPDETAVLSSQLSTTDRNHLATSITNAEFPEFGGHPPSWNLSDQDTLHALTETAADYIRNLSHAASRAEGIVSVLQP